MGVPGGVGLNQTGAERLALRVFVWGDELEIGGVMGFRVKSAPHQYPKHAQIDIQKAPN